ncbi:MAG: acyl carrier protein [Phycisphaeraceae bacterium]|nr:acyl carrier protein [Phycisphaerales bacterium]MCB9860937.1 acyl carrier protein [Phycisphaeraceae bacterium]
MTTPSAEQIRAFLLIHFADRFEQHNVDVSSIDDSYDLLREGIIDSLGILEMMGALEDEFGQAVDLEDMDPERMTQLGPLTDFLEQQWKAQA